MDYRRDNSGGGSCLCRLCGDGDAKMKKYPFSNFFSVIQRVGAGSELFQGVIPEGYVGFLYVISTEKHAGVTWCWSIDGELVGEGDDLSGSFNPPFLVEKNIEVKAKNDMGDILNLGVSCDGLCYEKPVKPEKLMPVLAEIKDELHTQVPLGELADEFVAVDDTVHMVYDEAQRGLNWTSCSILNMGPNSVYVAVNSWKRPSAPLLVGESQNIDFGRVGSIKKIYLVCDAGETAQVRLHALK